MKDMPSKISDAMYRQCKSRGYAAPVDVLTSQRVKASQRAMWKKGMLTTKRTPLGYVCEDRQKGWELEPKGAKIVRCVFDLALAGKKTGEIAHEMPS